MSLIRKKTLLQLRKINDVVNKELNKYDIGEDTTRDYPHKYKEFHNKDWDEEFDDYSKKTDELFGVQGMGQINPYMSDFTHDQKYANLISCNNPIEDKSIVSYEDFGLLSWFGGNTWQKRNGNKVQKFDQPDKDLFENRTIKKFKDFDTLND